MSTAAPPNDDAPAETTTDAAAAEPTAERTYRLKPVVEAEPPTRSIWSRIDRPFVLGFLLTLGGLAAFVLGLAISNLSTVLIYVALALFAALGLDPAVRFLERRGMSRGLATASVILGLLVIIAIVISSIIPTVVEQITSFVQDIPAAIDTFLASDFYARVENQFGDPVEMLVGEIQNFLSDPANIAAIGGGALQVGASIATGISGAIIVLVLTLYFVATLPAMKQALLRFAPARDRENVQAITDQITESVGSYVLGMVTLAFFNSLFVFTMFLILGLPFPLLLATVAFAITLIPLVGSVIFWVIGTGLALIANPLDALIFGIAYMVYMQVEAYWLTPKVMNKAVSIPGALVVIGALVGGTLLGLLGALVAVPVTASILIMIKQIWFPRQDARV